MTAAGAAAGAAADGGDGAAADREAAEAQRLARVVFALLVLACVAAFFVTQRLKHTPTVLQRFQLTPRFAPGHPGPAEEEHISFKLARSDEVTVRVIDASGNVVATLASDYPVTRYKQLSLRWNGRRGVAHGYRRTVSSAGHVFLLARTGGALAPPGEYHVLVSLRAQRREVRSPHDFTLVGG